MKKNNSLLLYLVFMLFLFSCTQMSDVGKTLRNEKVRTTDEFLVKKRQPLSLPPDYEKLPKPGSKNSKEEGDEDKINKILKIPETQTTKTGSSSVEQSIINKIRK